ncbi:MAG TPA: hypothetical protein VG407_06270 [Caulobacteraceae bacterium]|nr:hypothetical protein [Caulobacteraceae bacterium]
MAPPSSPAAPVAYAAADLNKAFAAAFGAPAPADKVVTRDGQDAMLRYRPARLVSLGTVTVLISEARTDGCHGCYGELAVHYLTRDGTGFKPAGAWPEISDGGSFGEPPNWSIRTDLFSGPALVVHAGGTWQGCTVDYADIIELTPDRPIVRARRVLMTYSDDSADGRDFDGSLRAVDKDRAFAVDYASAHKRTVDYVRSGEVYQAAHGAPGLPSC